MNALPLPCAPQIEDEVISCLIVNSEAETLEIIESLEPDDFLNRANKLIYATVKRLSDEGEHYDMLSVTTRLKDDLKLDEIGGSYHLNVLASKHTVGFKALYGVQILKEKTRLRRLLEIAEDLRTSSYSNANSKEVVTNFESRISSVLNNCSEENLLTSGTKRVFEMVDSRLKGEKVGGISTGIKSFDDIFFGLQNSQYYVVAGRPSAGKTAMVDQFCINFIKEKLNILYVPLESSEDRVIGKIACKMSSISFTKFIQNKCNESELRSIRSSTQIIQNSNIVVKRPTSNTPDALRSLLVREIRKNETQIFIIDYLQKILDERGDPRLGVMQASMLIQDICVKTKSIGIIICQMNRDAEKEKRPRMGHLKESGQIEQDADNICLLWSEKEKHELEPSELMPAILTIEKNKDGISGVDQKLFFDRELMKFKERIK